jgi:hypothetical protein
MNPKIKNIKYTGTLSMCFIIVLTAFFAEAQTLKFQKVYGGLSYDYGNDLIQTADSGYLLLCTSNSFSNSSDIYLLKVDQQGNYQWQRTYGGTEIEGACKIKFTQDGNIAMAGHTSSYLYNSYDFYLIKANMNGDTLWTKHYGTTEWDFANSMDTCADGGFIMAGKTYDTGNAFSDILIVKTDTDGNEQWRKTIGGNKDDVANSIISIPDGYLVCGTSSTGIHGGSDIYVIKLNISGDIVWEHYDGEQFDDEGTGIFYSSDNSIIYSGKRRTNANPENYNTNIRKLTQNGQEYWIIPYTTSGPIDIQINSIIEGYNKKITTIGSFDGNSLGTKDMVMFMWDSAGFYLNSGTFGGSKIDYGKNIIKTLDFGYAMIGSTNSFGTAQLSKIHFVKTDTLLPSLAPISLVIGINERQLTSKNNEVFPNPFFDESTIQVLLQNDNVGNSKMEFKLYNQLGIEVTDQIALNTETKNNNIEFKVKNLSLNSGIYYYRITCHEKTYSKGKFTILSE